MPVQHLHLASCMFENIDCGLSGFRHEVVVERVRPEKNFRTSSWSPSTFLKPRSESFRSEWRNLPFSRNTCCHFGDVTQTRQLSKQIDETGSDCRQACPLV